MPRWTFRSVYEIKTGKYLYQKPLDAICIYQLECDYSQIKDADNLNEIIEFSMVVIDVHQREVAGEFHTYIRLSEDNEISTYCQ